MSFSIRLWLHGGRVARLDRTRLQGVSLNRKRWILGNEVRVITSQIAVKPAMARVQRVGAFIFTNKARYLPNPPL